LHHNEREHHKINEQLLAKMKSVFFAFRNLILCSIIICFCSNVSLAQIVWHLNDSLHPTVYVANITITGNKKTKEAIIVRELIFHKNDTLNTDVLFAAAQRSMENVMNTSLFNFVEIHVTPQDITGADITIIVKEKWYVWPFPIFEGVDRNINEWWQTKDFSRVNYGMYLLHENFRGRKENLQINARFGYSLKLGLTYNVPYIDKAKTQGLAFSAGTQRYRETAYALAGNQLKFYTNSQSVVRRETYAWLRYTKRKGIYRTQNIFAEYRDVKLDDSLSTLNPNYLKSSDNRIKMILAGVSYRYEQVDFNVYPLIGYAISGEVTQNGLELLHNEPAILSATLGARRFIKLSPRWYHAISVRAKVFSSPTVPFYLQRGLGYGNDFVRGYELYVVNGQYHFVAKNNFKFALLPLRKIKLNFIRTEKFNTIPIAIYINMFADAGYARSKYNNENNTLNNNILSGYGVGIDVVSYYNLVWRFEYAFTNIGKHGFFVHFSSPI